MTHDELLAKIDGNFPNEGTHLDQAIAIGNLYRQGLFALRAVVELHKPDTFNIHGQTVSVCPECNSEYCWSDEEGQYPCPTIQAIQEQLK